MTVQCVCYVYYSLLYNSVGCYEYMSIYLGVVFEEVLSLQYTKMNCVILVHSGPGIFGDMVYMQQTYQIVNCIFWFHFTDLNKSLSQCWHDVLHEVVP